MTTAPKRPCSHPGCPALVERGRCAQHRRAKTRSDQEARGTAAQRGYDARWRRYAKRFLRRHPLCRSCEARGYVTPATLVDHIVPAKQAPELFWEPSNHQPLCRACHAAKTAQERAEVPG